MLQPRTSSHLFHLLLHQHFPFTPIFGPKFNLALTTNIMPTGQPLGGVSMANNLANSLAKGLGVRPYSTKAHRPTSGTPDNLKFSTFDLETIKCPTDVVPNGQGNQIPVSISIKSPDQEVKLFLCLEPHVKESQLDM